MKARFKDLWVRGSTVLLSFSSSTLLWKVVFCSLPELGAVPGAALELVSGAVAFIACD